MTETDRSVPSLSSTEPTLPFGQVKTFRGAKVRSIGIAPDGQLLDRIESHVERYSRVGYELAMANRHKSWAKRWLRNYRPGKFI
jgi:hypothetical protein